MDGAREGVEERELRVQALEEARVALLVRPPSPLRPLKQGLDRDDGEPIRLHAGDEPLARGEEPLEAAALVVAEPALRRVARLRLEGRDKEARKRAHARRGGEPVALVRERRRVPVAALDGRRLAEAARKGALLRLLRDSSLCGGLRLSRSSALQALQQRRERLLREAPRMLLDVDGRRRPGAPHVGLKVAAGAHGRRHGAQGELQGRERGVLRVERGHLQLREVGRERLVAAVLSTEVVRPLGQGKRLVLLPHPRREAPPRGIGPLERLGLCGREAPGEWCRGLLRLSRLLIMMKQRGAQHGRELLVRDHGRGLYVELHGRRHPSLCFSTRLGLYGAQTSSNEFVRICLGLCWPCYLRRQMFTTNTNYEQTPRRAHGSSAAAEKGQGRRASSSRARADAHPPRLRL